MEGRQKNKIKERKKKKKKHDSSHPLPPLAPGLSHEGEDEHTHSRRTAIT